MANNINNTDDNIVIHNSNEYQVLEDNAFIEASKRRKKKMYTMLGILALILLALIAFAAIKIAIDNKTTETNTIISHESTESDYEGLTSNNVYVNKWADLKFEMGSTWHNASSQQYALYIDDVTECMFYGENDGGSSIVFLKMNLSDDNLNNKSEDEMLKEISLGFIAKMSSSEIPEVSYKLLGNQLYLCMNAEGNVEGKNVNIITCIRSIDNRAILINIISDNVDETSAILEMIDSCD